MNLRRAGLAIAIATLSVAAPAGAETPPDGRSAAQPGQRLEEAKALTQEAVVQFRLAHFEEALDKYTRAYQRYPTPGLLFNIGQCHKMLKHYEQALFAFTGYLRDKPDAANRAVVEGLIADSKRELETQRLEAQRVEAAAQEQSRAKLAPAPSAPAPPAAPPTDAKPDGATPGNTGGSPGLRVAGIATASAGVLLIGTGIFFGLRSSSARDELGQLSAQRGTWSDHYQSVYDDGRSAARTANVLYVVGGVALATGGVLAFFGFRKTAEAPVAVSFAPTPNGASAAFAGRF